MSQENFIKSMAAVAWEPGKPLSLEEIEVMPPQQGEVLVKMVSASVCYTDAFTLSGADPEALFPTILGHEGAGIVEQVGDGVTLVSKGDHVIPLYIPECAECTYCMSKKTNMCQKIVDSPAQAFMSDGTTRFYKDGKPIYHYMGVSSFSEYTVIPEVSLAKINKQAPLDKICLLGCGITTGMGAVIRKAKVEAGNSIAIFGLDCIGLSAISGAVLAQASRIICVDDNEDRFKIAKKLGATDCLNPKKLDKPIQEIIIEMTNGGVDFTFEATGNITTMRQAFESCHPCWGEAVIIGISRSNKDISVNPLQLLGGRIWKGAVFGGVKGRSELPDIVDSYLADEFNIDDFITHKIPHDEINNAFDLLNKGKGIRTVLVY